ncbi:YihY/virulence factor BrkB family protein [Ponticoccus litoralis]|uniref:YihY/virulence factor BrkB family protein n=1 Tax=Ponticoccus litoralis TaxID=422297 RepID=A0AAW9SQ08_9RHOB
MTTTSRPFLRRTRSPRDMTGTRAYGPRNLPLKAWLRAFWRLPGRVAEDRITLIAAGVAFYGLLSLFPAITAMMAVAGLLFDPNAVTEELQSVAQLMPENAATIVMDQARGVAGSHEKGLGLAAILGFALAIWSASRGVGSLMQGINVAFDKRESRGFIRQTFAQLLLTVVLVLGVAMGFAATIVIPTAMKFVPLGDTEQRIIDALRWGAMLGLSVVGVMILYRYAPDRDRARWRWLVPGAVLATVLWVIGCVGFSLYVENFGNYQQTFGTLTGVVVLLLWLWLSATVLLVGAELNAALDAVNREADLPPDAPEQREKSPEAIPTDS